MTPEQRTQAEYVAEHLLGWRKLSADAWVTGMGQIFDLDWLLTGNGMLATLEAVCKLPDRKRGDFSAECLIRMQGKDDYPGWLTYECLDPPIVLAAAYHALLDRGQEK